MLEVKAGNFDFFQYLTDKKVVLYGYGENGKRILPWLQHFNINIEEVWDARAEDNQKAEGINVCRMHEGLTDKTVILITVLDENIRLVIKQELMNLGYSDILEWRCIELGCRSRIYAEYLPFLLEGVV